MFRAPPERCPSGRWCQTRNLVWRKSPWVRIPPSPLPDKPARTRAPRTVAFQLGLEHALEHTWRGVRVVEGAGLEIMCGATHRGFESRPLRRSQLSQQRPFMPRVTLLPPTPPGPEGSNGTGESGCPWALFFFISPTDVGELRIETRSPRHMFLGSLGVLAGWVAFYREVNLSNFGPWATTCRPKRSRRST